MGFEKYRKFHKFWVKFYKHIIFQVSTTSVQVSWEGLVERIECADEFLVKSWDKKNTKDYKLSELLPTSQFSFIVTDLEPNKEYVFQVIFAPFT